MVTTLLTSILLSGTMTMTNLASPTPPSSHWLEEALLVDDLKLLGARILLLFGIVLLAIVVDLVRGVQRAIRLGVARRSKGYRATISKINEYFSFLTLFALIDTVILLSGVLHTLGLEGAPIFPICTAGACFYPIYIEIRSVREKMSKAHQKDLKDSLEGLGKLLQHASQGQRDEVLKGLSNIITGNDDEQTNN